jgi:NADPH-dependent 2,4-dienoyl-CoA reductase/sulfur reductase-like enzyme
LAGEAPGARRETLTPDVVVVGAGPGGLAAAWAAATAGLEVLVVDERARPGGQFYKQPAEGFDVTATALDPQFRAGRALEARARDASVTILDHATVWGAFSPDEIGVVTEDQALTLRPKRLVLAAGAYERAVPFPGWTLPGVMTTGAAQTLLRAYQTAPGRRVLIAGNGPLNLQVAVELARAGVEVVALCEQSRAPGPWAATALATMALSAPSLLYDGIAHRLSLARRGVPVLHRHAIVRAEGDGAASAATVAAIDDAGRLVAGSERRFAIDAVCLGYGFLPQSELARALGCRHRFDASRGGLAVERAANGRASRPDVFVVGDAGGLGGAPSALAQGVLAGAAVADDLAAPRRAALAPHVGQARRNLVRHRRFQAALWSLYRGPLLTDELATPDTVVCRCEDVTLATALKGFAGGAGELGSLKRVTRAGMGRCQGRYCAPLLAVLNARQAGTAPGELSLFAPRFPFKPVPIAVLASTPRAKCPQDEQ